MNHTHIALAAAMTLLFGLACADVDLADFDTDRMQAIDDNTKAIDAVIAAKDPGIAPFDIDALLHDLKWTEEYFSRKGNADDAVQLAQQAQKSATALGQLMAARDYDAAFGEFRALKRGCRGCHDVYKPPSL